MKHDSIQQFVKLRQSLLQEKAVLETRLNRILQALATTPSPASSGITPGRWTMSAAARAKISAAQKKRWAKRKASAPAGKPVKKARHKMSAEGRARIVAAQKARWAKIRAAKQ